MMWSNSCAECWTNNPISRLGTDFQSLSEGLLKPQHVTSKRLNQRRSILAHPLRYPSPERRQHNTEHETMTNTANRERRQAAPLAAFAPGSVLTMIPSQRALSVAFDISRGSGAVRGSGAKVRPAEITVQRLFDGHSETERGELSAENCLEADLHHVTLKVRRPVKRATDGGRVQPPSPPFTSKARDAKTSHTNTATRFSEVLINQLNTQRHGDAVSNSSRGSGAERGNVSVAKAHGENRERSISSGHSETGHGELLAENYVEAGLHNVTLEVWRPVIRVTDGGRLQPLSPPIFSTREA